MTGSDTWFVQAAGRGMVMVLQSKEGEVTIYHEMFYYFMVKDCGLFPIEKAETNVIKDVLLFSMAFEVLW